jgi:CHASE3 domain sensor protein
MRALGLQMLAATSVLMIAALLLMSVTLSHLKESRQDSEAMQDTLLQITTIESRLMDFDGAWNGYVLSGNPWYLQRIKDDHSELYRALSQLKQSLRNDALQMERHKAIAALVSKRDALNDYLQNPAHTAAVARVEVVQTARIVTDNIRAVLWQVLDRERQKRRANDTAMIAQAEESFWIAVGIVFLTCLFGASCLVLSFSPRVPDHRP